MVFEAEEHTGASTTVWLQGQRRGGFRSFWPIKRFSMERGDAAARWFPHKADFSGENSVRVGRFGFRHGTRKALSRLKQGLRLGTAHRAEGRDHVHAEGDEGASWCAPLGSSPSWRAYRGIGEHPHPVL